MVALGFVEYKVILCHIVYCIMNLITVYTSISPLTAFVLLL